MRSIRDILTLQAIEVGALGTSFTLRRPSALDLIEAMEVSAKRPESLQAWFVWRHLIENGLPVYATLEDVLKCDAIAVMDIAKHCEAIYSEGRD